MKRWLLRILIFLLIVIFVVPLLIPLPPDGVAAETLADPDGRFIEVNGLQTYYIERGPGDGEPVLLLHGWGASTFSWRDNIDALAESGYRVIAFDRPPYGLSAKTGDNLPLTQSQQAVFTAAFMDALQLERAALIGHSMGAGTIAYFAAAFPERVDKLVFVGGAPRIDEATGGSARLNDTIGIPAVVNSLLEFPSFNRWARILARAFVRPETFTDLQRSAYYDPSIVTEEVAAGYQRQLQVVGWDEALIKILSGRGFGDQPLTPEQIQAIEAPALIIWGENDTWVPLEAGERLRELLPNVVWIVYPQVGHLPMEEVPTQFNADVLSFLEGEADE